MATHPDSFEGFSESELQNLKQLAQDIDAAAQQTGVSRREMLQSAAVLGAGALAGGVGTTKLIDQASADASSSDSDGNVGLPSDRVDIFADGVDSLSLSADEAKISGQPSSAYTPIGQGGLSSNYLELVTADGPLDGSKKYYSAVDADVSGLSATDSDQTGLYTAIKTSDVDAWAFNPLVEIGDNFSGKQAFAMEANVNTDTDGVGIGALFSGVNPAGNGAEADTAVKVLHQNAWKEGFLSRDVSEYHFLAKTDATTNVWGVQPSGNVDQFGSAIFNISTLKSEVDENLIYNSPISNSLSSTIGHIFEVGGSAIMAVTAAGDGSGGLSERKVNFLGSKTFGLREI